MNKIKTYSLFLESSLYHDHLLDIKEFIKDLHLSDDNMKISFQIQENKVVFYLIPDHLAGFRFFKLIDMKDYVFHLINFMKNCNYEVISVKYRSDRGYWITIFDNKPNRWGVYSKPEDIFDIQDLMLGTKSDSIGIIFKNNE